MIRFHRSAARHGISRERAEYVIRNHDLYLYQGESAHRDFVLFLGHDQGGVPLEVGAVETDDGLLVIHAMGMRAKYAERWNEARG